jgi:hypothetical protein
MPSGCLLFECRAGGEVSAVEHEDGLVLPENGLDATRDLLAPLRLLDDVAQEAFESGLRVVLLDGFVVVGNYVAHVAG